VMSSRGTGFDGRDFVSGGVGTPAAYFSAQLLDPPASRVPALARGWVAQPVRFDAGGVTIYGTYTHPHAAAPGRIPAALLIAGCCGSDRNDNGTGETVANWLSADGVASLRYDKLGTGKTALGRYAADPARVGTQPFNQEAAAALAFLARQRAIDRRRLAVFGHSEGGLYALLLATGLGGDAPRVHALGLLEPLSIRVLDHVNELVSTQVAIARQAGHLSAAQASSIKKTLTRAIVSLRTTGTFPRDLPDWMAGVGLNLNAAAQLYWAQVDRYDPAAVAAKLTPQMPVLLTCSNADSQISCGEVNHLAAGLMQARAKLDIVHFDGVDHLFREDPSRGVGPYTKPLAFSPRLRSALRAFTANNL
jgi:acetyl esterase/lipase